MSNTPKHIDAAGIAHLFPSYEERELAYRSGQADAEAGTVNGFRCEYDDEYFSGVQAVTCEPWDEHSHTEIIYPH